MTYNQLGFALVRLQTESFAIIESAYKKTGEVNLHSQLGFGLDAKESIVSCTVKFSFEKKANQPFLILETTALFKIETNDFKEKVIQEDGSFLIAKALAIHFAVLTVGSARGILHAKTENTVYNDYLLPTIDVNQLVQDDISFSK